MKKILTAAVFILLFAGMCSMNYLATGVVFKNQPSWYFINRASYKKMLHMAGVGFGFRALAGDIEYINFLQYYGDRNQIANNHKFLYGYIDNITDADPNFTFAYTFGSAILAFNLRRYDEAVKVIRKGLEYNPSIWQLRLYLGAILYKDKYGTKNYVKFLEEALQFNDHPAIIERLLGNIYETYKKPDEIVKYWVKTYRITKDKRTRDFAYGRIMFFLSEHKVSDPSMILKELENR
jgi:tetratricopeptide (TPR) repeat protein